MRTQPQTPKHKDFESRYLREVAVRRTDPAKDRLLREYLPTAERTAKAFWQRFRVPSQAQGIEQDDMVSVGRVYALCFVNEHLTEDRRTNEKHLQNFLRQRLGDFLQLSQERQDEFVLDSSEEPVDILAKFGHHAEPLEYSEPDGSGEAPSPLTPAKARKKLVEILKDPALAQRASEYISYTVDPSVKALGEKLGHGGPEYLAEVREIDALKAEFIAKFGSTRPKCPKCAKVYPDYRGFGLMVIRERRSRKPVKIRLQGRCSKCRSVKKPSLTCS